MLIHILKISFLQLRYENNIIGMQLFTPQNSFLSVKNNFLSVIKLQNLENTYNNKNSLKTFF